MAEENNEIKNVESVRSVYDLWLHSIFEQLDALKRSIFLAREGFSSIQDIISTGELQLYLVRERNFKYCLLLFESLLNDLKSQLKEDFFNKQLIFLKGIKAKVYSNINDFFELYSRGKNKTYYPKKTYYLICDLLERQRAELIQEISHLLYAQPKQVKNKPL